MIKKIKNYFYELITTYCGKMSNWAWHKRWNRGRNKPHKHYLRGEKK